LKIDDLLYFLSFHKKYKEKPIKAYLLFLIENHKS